MEGRTRTSPRARGKQQQVASSKKEAQTDSSAKIKTEEEKLKTCETETKDTNTTKQSEISVTNPTLNVDIEKSEKTKVIATSEIEVAMETDQQDASGDHGNQVSIGTGHDSINVAGEQADMHVGSNESEQSLERNNLIANISFEESSKGNDSDNQNLSNDQDTYFFESDHLALKGNKDYQALLRTIAILEGQRIRAINEIDILYEKQNDALKDPIGFVDKLQRNVDMGLPKPQVIASLPHICWENYVSTAGSLNYHKHMTRMKKQTPETKPATPEPQAGPSTSSNQTTASLVTPIIRGRVKDGSKPATFNQLWTAEEQKHLEDLLRTYPPEEVENRRWEKIAAALGNRTPTQVASRVQKYFIKLAKAGLPIPGRMPNVQHYSRRSAHRHQRMNRFYYPSSTFMTSIAPPVYMSDDEYGGSYGDTSSVDAAENLGVHSGADVEVSDDESIPIELRDSEEYHELMELKRLKKIKLQSEGAHVGYKCDQCDMEPITGTRYHCMDCPPDTSVDFCEYCADTVYETSTHKSSHHMKAIRSVQASGFVDRDYTRFIPGDYNYLDPNYMPAS